MTLPLLVLTWPVYPPAALLGGALEDFFWLVPNWAPALAHGPELGPQGLDFVLGLGWAQLGMSITHGV